MLFKKYQIFTFLILLLNFGLTYPKKGGVTFDLSGGRLGNKLLNYCKAKILSEKYNLDLYYPKFPYVEDLKISSIEKKYSQDIDKLYSEKIHLNKKNYIEHLKNTDNKLYTFSFAFMLSINSLAQKCKKDKKIRNLLRQAIAPKDNKLKPDLNSKYINVAVHYRAGSRYDTPLASPQLYSSDTINTFNTQHSIRSTQKRPVDKRYPHKFPPLQWHLDQVKILCNKVKNKPICINIFTDKKDPDEIVNVFQKNIKNPKVKIKLHKGGVLKDLFNMAACDVLIRPKRSTFSVIAEIIGDHQVIIIPNEMKWINEILYVTKTKTKGNLKKIKSVKNN